MLSAISSCRCEYKHVCRKIRKWVYLSLFMNLNLSIPTSYYQLLTPWLISKIASNKYFFKFLAGDQFCNCLFVYVHHFGKSYFPFSFTYALACLLILICLTGEQFSQLDENKISKTKEECTCWWPHQLAVSHRARLLSQQPTEVTQTADAMDAKSWHW